MTVKKDECYLNIKARVLRNVAGAKETARCSQLHAFPRRSSKACGGQDLIPAHPIHQRWGGQMDPISRWEKQDPQRGQPWASRLKTKSVGPGVAGGTELGLSGQSWGFFQVVIVRGSGKCYFRAHGGLRSACLCLYPTCRKLPVGCRRER